MRPSTPPASLMRLKAVSIPSFICRPSSRAEPENGAAMPKRISLSLMPRRRRTGGDRRDRGGGGSTGGSKHAGEAWARDRAFEIAELAVGNLAINSSSGHRGTAVIDAAVEHLRQVGTFGFVGGGVADHHREFLHHRLNARSRNVAACQRRADDRSEREWRDRARYRCCRRRPPPCWTASPPAPAISCARSWQSP